MDIVSRRGFINLGGVGAGALAVGAMYSGGAQAQGPVAAGIVLEPNPPATPYVDDTANIQNALNTSRDVYLSPGTFTISDSLYMQTNFQELRGQATITMSAALGKPCLFIGAINSDGDPAANPIIHAKVSGISFNGTGTKAAGSAGIVFVRATTTRLDSVWAWNFYAGIGVTERSLVNTIINADLRYNVIGVYDPSTDPGVSDLQASQFFGGRIEANAREGVLLGSPNVKFFGTVIEGNGLIANGGDGTTPEVTINGGGSGSVHFIDCYMESFSEKTVTNMIHIASGAIHRRLFIVGGEYFASAALTRYIVESSSTSTSQGVYITNGQFSSFKNYVKATLQNNSAVVVTDTWADSSPDVFADVTASGGALIQHANRVQGIRTNVKVTAPRIYESSDTDAGSQFNFRKVSYRISQTLADNFALIIPIARLATGAIYLVDVVAVGKVTAGVGVGFKVSLIASSVDVKTMLSSVDDFGASENPAGGKSIKFEMEPNGVEVQNLTNTALFDFYVTMHMRF